MPVNKATEVKELKVKLQKIHSHFPLAVLDNSENYGQFEGSIWLMAAFNAPSQLLGARAQSSLLSSQHHPHLPRTGAPFRGSNFTWATALQGKVSTAVPTGTDKATATSTCDPAKLTVSSLTIFPFRLPPSAPVTPAFWTSLHRPRF